MSAPLRLSSNASSASNVFWYAKSPILISSTGYKPAATYLKNQRSFVIIWHMYTITLLFFTDLLYERVLPFLIVQCIKSEGSV